MLFTSLLRLPFFIFSQQLLKIFKLYFKIMYGFSKSTFETEIRTQVHNTMYKSMINLTFFLSIGGLYDQQE